MRNKKLLRLLKVMSFMSALALHPFAYALQVTLNVPDCPSGQTLSFSNNVLGCTGGTPAPDNSPSSCSITAVPSSTSQSPLPAGTQVQLTAACSNGVQPITYSWNIGIIQPSAIVAPSQTTTYTVTPSNSAGTGTSFNTTVYAGTAAPAGSAPSGCSISQSPNTLATAVTAGTTVFLTVSCSSGGAATSCTWNNGISSSSCSVNIAAPAATTAYSVTASNANGPASPVSTSVQVTNSPVSGGSGINMCTGSDNLYTVNWPASGQVRPTTNGFGNQRIAFKLTIPSTFSPSLNINHLGFIHIAEVPGSAVAARDMTVSRNACDFTGGEGTIHNAIGYGDTAPGVNFTVNNPTGYLSAGGNFNLQSGDVVYVNVRNSHNGAPTCPNSSCNILFDFATPNRY